jgi:outer membrane protein assembly factor BamB
MPYQFLFVTGLFLLGAGTATRHTFASSQELPLPTESDLSRNPALAPDWANRVMANDLKVRATAEAPLVQGAGRSLPLLRRFLNSRNGNLHLETSEIIRRIGPAAIPMLTDMLRDDRASIRRSAVDVLIDLAPDTERIQPPLRRALGDADSLVARDAARALGALGKRAGPSVSALVKALSHEEPHVRLYAAEALASIGPKAAKATKDLARAVADPIPGVRWAACEALASIGPAAQPAVPQLIEALKDEFLYVRICAAGALGSIGPKAQTALEALRAAANDPPLRDEVEWALNRIAGVEPGEHAGSPPAPAAPVAPEPRTTVAQTGNPPVDWNTTTGRNIVWSVELGNETFGRPVVAGDAVYVGTDKARHMNPAFQEECGVLMAFRAKDGKFLWQDVAPRVKRGLREFLLPSTTSSPCVEGNRLYDAASGRELWRFDGNPKDARWRPRPGVLSRSSIIASPVFADGRVFLAMGHDPLHGNGPSLVHAISPNGQGDVTESRLLWTSREVGRVVETPIAKNGLLYVGDLGGMLHCLDAATGAHLWKHETSGAIWGCLLLAGDRLYVGNVEGGMTVLRAGRRKELLAQIQMDAPLYSRPALVQDALYLATAHRLYLIVAKP